MFPKTFSIYIFNLDIIKDISLTVEQLQLISAELANHYKIIPVSKKNQVLTLFFDESQSHDQIKEELELITGFQIELIAQNSAAIRKNLSVYYRYEVSKSHNTSNVDFLEQLIFESKNIGSSDIHFEIFETEGRVRIRIDGFLIEKYTLDKSEYLELVNKIKIKSNLDITEKRLPQDGRIEYDNFDIRVSVLPTLYGEKIVMRLLGKDASKISIDKLGFEVNQKKNYLEGIKNTSGIVLISGPTGSGKTTTLYATLKLLNDSKRNIVTIEDPIEYTLKGINQVQLKESIGLTFTSALRSFLRQDPDIIMLGEIRDAETAQMAIRASLTGHLVLSTIHTNSAIGTISRLIDMGIQPFLIAETLKLSVAQRLLRKLCEHCKSLLDFNQDDFPSNFLNKKNIETHFVPVGCERCHYTGYSGRTAIYEVIPVGFEFANQIKSNSKNLNKLKLDNVASLAEKALELFLNGETSYEEIYPFLLNN